MENKYTLKFSRHKIYFIILLFAWLVPSRIFNIIPGYQYVLFFLRAILIILFCRGLEWKIPKPRNDEILILLFILSGLPGMLITGREDIGNYLWYVCDIMNVFLIWLFFKKSDANTIFEFLKFSKWVWFFLLIVSFYYGSIMNWGGDYGNKVFFVGGKDATVQCFTMFFALAAFYDKKYKTKIQLNTWILAVVSVVFSYIYTSGLGMVMLGCMIILYFACEVSRDNLVKFAFPFVTIVVLIIVYYLVVSLKYMEMPWVVSIIENILNKDASLTGRDWIYTESLKLIGGSPIIGYGYDNTVIADNLGSVFVAFNTAHNSFLQMLLDDGIVGLVLFILMFYFTIKRMLKTRASENNTVYISLVVMCIGGLTGLIIPSNYFWIVFMLTSLPKADEMFSVEESNLLYEGD